MLCLPRRRLCHLPSQNYPSQTEHFTSHHEIIAAASQSRQNSNSSKMSHSKGARRAGISFHPDVCRRSVAAFSILLRRVDVPVTLASFPPRFRLRFVPFFASSVVFGTDGLSTNPIPGRGGLMAFYEFCESDSCHLRRSRLIRACA
jgi:hypothetical protein